MKTTLLFENYQIKTLLHLLTKPLALLLMVFATSLGWGQSTETINCPEGTIVSNEMLFEMTNFTISHKKNNSTSFAVYSPWRFYTNNTITITGKATVANIKSLVITSISGNPITTANVSRSFDGNPATSTLSISTNPATVGTITITGTNVKKIILTASSQIRISKIDINYEAVPTVINKTITFNSNGGTGTMAAQASVQNQNAPIATNTFTREGYNFMGWGTTPTTTTPEYPIDINGIIVPEYDFANDITLYAIWKGTVTYIGNGAINNYEDNTQYAPDQYVTTAPANAFSRPEYQFSHWNTAASGTGISYAPSQTDAFRFTGNTTLYAFWAPIGSSTVTFDANGGTGIMPTQVASSATALNNNTFTREGYTFIGWNTQANGAGTNYNNNDFYSFTENNTLYAQWQPQTLTITFDANGGTGIMDTQSILADASASLNSQTFARIGYSFTGWATTASGTMTFADQANYTMGTSNVTLYAVWIKNTYAITFNNNGGSGTMTPQNIAYNESANLTTNTFTRTGFTFAGWATTASGTVAYANNASYTIGANDVDLYAVWEVNLCTFTNFDDSTSLPSGWGGDSVNANTTAHYSSSPYSRALGSGRELITPLINLPKELSFNVDASGTGNQTLTISYSINNGSTWTSIKTYAASTTGSIRTITSSEISSLANVENVRFKFSSSQNTTYIDDVTICTYPPCPKPDKPEGTFSQWQNCETLSINYTHGVSEPTADVEYYWQTTSNGTDKTKPVTTAATTTTSTTMYVRAYSPTNNCWSDALDKPVTVASHISTITQHPLDLVKVVGDYAQFTVTASHATIYQWQISQDNGANWTDIPGTNSSLYHISSVTTTQNNQMFRALVSFYGCTPIISQPAKLTVLENTPTLTVSAITGDLSRIYGENGNAASFTITGAHLSGDVTITAPTNFYISNSESGPFINTLSVSQTAGTINTQTIYIRLKPAVNAATYNESISFSSLNATINDLAIATTTVSRKELTITGTTVNNKTYNGNDTATFTSQGSLVGIAHNDDITFTSTATFNNANAGIDKPVTMVANLVGTKKDNYTVTAPTGLTADIYKANLTATANNVTRGTLEPNPDFTISYNGFVAGETANTPGFTPPVANTTADSNSPIGNYPITLSGGTSNNYNILLIDGTLTVIFKKEFIKITNLSELIDEAEYVITNESSAYLMTSSRSTELPTGYFLNDDVELINGKIINPTSEQIWQIKNSADGKTIYNSVINKYVGWQTGNAASIEDVATNNSRWTFTYTAGKWTVKNVGTPERQLSYNSGSPRFAAYSNANQHELQIYKFAYTQCTEAPTATNTVASATSITTGESTNLSLSSNEPYSGITYQWQQSTDGGVQWDNVATNGNNSSYTATPLSTTQYRCIINCGALYTIATPVTINIVYCTSAGNTNFNAGVRGLIFNEINNINQPISTTAYTDYTNIQTNVHPGQNYQITVYNNTGGTGTSHTSVWIDWNQNSLFEEVERINLGTTTNNVYGITSLSPLGITVPNDAILGTTQMRITTKHSSYANNSCETGFSGETEDYTIIVSIPTDAEINIKGNNNTIIHESDAIATNNHTDFGTVNMGSQSAVHNFVIENIGLANLLITGNATLSGENAADFTITQQPSATISNGASSNLSIQFIPLGSGSREAYVTIPNSDSNENPYIFKIGGIGVCTTALDANVLPTSGPINTVVKITSEQNLTGAIVKLGNLIITPLESSNNQIYIRIPSGALSDNLTITTANGCKTSTFFNVLQPTNASCETSRIIAATTDLFISQVTDSGVDSLSYIEIYNGTNAPVSLNGYSIAIYNNGTTGTPSASVNLNRATPLPVNQTFIVAVGSENLTSCNGVTGADGDLADQKVAGGGINFQKDNNQNLGHDAIRLLKGNTVIDGWGVFGSETWASSLDLNGKSANFERKGTGTIPNAGTFNIANWEVTEWGDACEAQDYSGIGTYNAGVQIAPVITIQPTDNTYKCGDTTYTLSTTAAEGYAGGLSLIYQWFYNAPNSNSWTSVTDNENFSNSNTSNLIINNPSALENYQFYCEIRENTADCKTNTIAVRINGETATTSWNGTAWSNGAPSITKNVEIPAGLNYTTASGSFSARKLTVNGSLTIVSGTYVEVDFNVINNNTTPIIIKNNGTLIQKCDTDNSVANSNVGTIEMERITPPIFRYDYVYWSSPVTADSAYKLNSVSPLTLSSKFHSYNEPLNNWNLHQAGNQVMNPGTGYIIRGPSINNPSNILPSSKSPYTAKFLGKPNNGIVNTTVSNASQGWNLIGNPYPSAIDADALILQNQPYFDGAIYLWTHTSAFTSQNNSQISYSEDNYTTYNLTGSTGLATSRYIAAGQSFFIHATANTSSFTFNNAMRTRTNNDVFYRQANPTEVNDQANFVGKHRIWLSISNQARNLSNQTLVGYIENATNGLDWGYDANILNDGALILYSTIEQNKLSIQGKALPFSVNDLVPLGYKTNASGEFSIAIDNVDGVMSDKTIYLDDKLLRVVHNLTQGAYNFHSEIGTFNNRFVLRYTPGESLSNDDFDANNTIIVSKLEGKIIVKSFNENINHIEMYDILGRLLYQQNKLDGNNLAIPYPASNHQTIIVRVTLQNGKIGVKKIII